jgi:hypothetical protein
MSAKLPANFDPERYAAAHPDVGLSGLSPGDHYLLFGRLMRRDPAGRGARPKSVASEQVQPASSPSEPATPKSGQAGGPAPLPERIIDRPKEFDPTAVVQLPAPSRANAPEDGVFSLESLLEGSFASAEERDRICEPLIAYARLVSRECPNQLARVAETITCGSSLFQRGEIRLENAWFADRSTLRMMICGGSKPEAGTSGWSLRVYQARPATPHELRLAGQGTRLPAVGPVFHDIALFHPLMPLLIELSDADDVTQAITLLPFPSLLPGGTHDAELRALQVEANPIDAFWALSEKLLEETLGRPEWPERSITDLSIHSEDRAFLQSSGEVQEWITAIFQLGKQNRSTKRKLDGLKLVLPSDSLPTISALASRNLELDGAGHRVGPFLVCDAPNMRPRWSVALPPNQAPDANLPVLIGKGRKRSTNRNRRVLPIHLAIVGRPRGSFPTKAEAVATSLESYEPQPLTIAIDASDAGQTGALLSALRDYAGDNKPDVLVRFADGSDQAIATCLDDIVGQDRWKKVDTIDPQDLAGAARHQFMLTLSDRVKLDGRATIDELCRLLKEDESIGSMSCALSGEMILKSQAAIQPTSGGLFPSRVSFATSPHLEFYEPDVLQPLLDLTYPVVANTSVLTLWRTRAIAELSRRTSAARSVAADIRVSLDLMKAGYRNVCTTKVQAKVLGSQKRRDTIDPLGSVYLEPSEWADIVSRVCVLRELF